MRSAGPAAAFAGVLDGHRLWLAIEDAPGSLALRATGSGDVLTPGNEVRPDEQPGFKAARFDLDLLPGDAEPAYDVVLVPTRGRRPRPVTVDAVKPPRPGATWRLARTDEGVLRVHREQPPAAAELRSLEVTADGVRLALAGAGAGAGAHLALLVDDEPVHTLPTATEGDLVVATIDAASLPNLAEQGTQVVVGEPGGWLPVRRQANDLADPGRGAVLPTLVDRDGRERLRLRWSPRALLRAMVLGPEGDR